MERVVDRDPPPFVGSAGHFAAVLLRRFGPRSDPRTGCGHPTPWSSCTELSRTPLRSRRAARFCRWCGLRAVQAIVDLDGADRFRRCGCPCVGRPRKDAPLPAGKCRCKACPALHKKPRSCYGRNGASSREWPARVRRFPLAPSRRLAGSTASLLGGDQAHVGGGALDGLRARLVAAARGNRTLRLRGVDPVQYFGDFADEGNDTASTTAGRKAVAHQRCRPRTTRWSGRVGIRVPWAAQDLYAARLLRYRRHAHQE